MYYTKILFIVVFTTFFSLACSSSQPQTETPITPQANVHDFANLISEDFLKEHLYTFANDDFEGRGTGQRGIDYAADYVKNFYQEHNITPLGDNGSYFQHFNMSASVTSSYEFNLSRNTPESSFTVYKSSFSQLSSNSAFTRLSGNRSFAGNIVFAGYGALDSSRSVDHLADIDLTDKWVMLFSSIPHIVDGDTLISPEYDLRQRNREIFFGRGAAGLLIIRDMDEDIYIEQAESYSQLMGIPTGFALPGGSPRVRMTNPILSVSPKMAAKLIGMDGGEGGLQKYHDGLSRNPSAFSPAMLNYHLSVESVTNNEEIPVKNIVAVIEGRDPVLKDEYIVISAHYDHMGLGLPDASGDFIYNGADDNGSGSVNILGQALALKEAQKAGVGPKRSVILLHVTAEEVGLLGSRYYSDNPTVPIESIIANINTDMIGRVDDDFKERGIDNYVYVIGAEIISSDLNNRLSEASEIRGNQLELSMRFNDLDDRNQFYRRSDHWNFGRLGIPFVFFFSGVHADYHQPSDTPDNITYGPYTKRAQLIYSTVIQIANNPDKPIVDSEEFVRRTQVNPR